MFDNITFCFYGIEGQPIICKQYCEINFILQVDKATVFKFTMSMLNEEVVRYISSCLKLISSMNETYHNIKIQVMVTIIYFLQCYMNRGYRRMLNNNAESFLHLREKKWNMQGRVNIGKMILYMSYKASKRNKVDNISIVSRDGNLKTNSFHWDKRCHVRYDNTLNCFRFILLFSLHRVNSKL